MLPVNFGFDPATRLNAPIPAPKGGGVTPAAAGPTSFHDMLRGATAARTDGPAETRPTRREEAGNPTDSAATAAGAEGPAETVPARDEEAVNKTKRGAGTAARTKASTKSAPTHGADAVRGAGRAATVDNSDSRPTGGNAAGDTLGQPVWELLAQIVQKLTAHVGTSTGAVESQDDADASDPEKGDDAEDLSTLVDLLKQLQESAGALTAESGIPLDRLRQMLEQWQAGANASQTPGFNGRLLHLLKSIQAALPGLACDRGAAAMASPGGAAEQVPVESADPAGAVPMAPGEPQHVGRAVDAGRASGGVLPDAKDTKVTEAQTDAAVRADERGPDAGRGMPGPSHAAASPDESHRPTALPSEPQTSEGSFVLPRKFEPAPDTQSGVSDDSRPPAEKATAGLALSAADKAPAEGGSPGLHFDAALRDVNGLAVPDNSPDKPAEAAAAGKGRDAAAAATRTDVFDQIVQRAAVHVKNDQGEIRIDLKPDVLGQVRMHIMTDNQQVTVRILTEHSMVRDMIQSNIHQLKSDLQQQGLQVQRVEVAVADDPRQNPRRQAQPGPGWKGHADGGDAPAADEISAELRPEVASRWDLGGQTTINMFA